MSARICRREDAEVTTLDAATISSLLLRNWDVLGVADVDVEPEAEYRHEGARLRELLLSGSGPDGLTAHLTSAASALHATPDRSRDRRAAEAIYDAHRE